MECRPSSASSAGHRCYLPCWNPGGQGECPPRGKSCPFSGLRPRQRLGCAACVSNIFSYVSDSGDTSLWKDNLVAVAKPPFTFASRLRPTEPSL